MVNVVVFGLVDDYLRIAYSGLSEDPGILTVKHSYSLFARKSLSYTLQRVISLPYIQFLIDSDFRKSASGVSISPSALFVFFESKYAYQSKYIRHLRDVYPNCRIVLVLVNPMSVDNRAQYWEKHFMEFDKIVTCVKEDAVQYGFLFHDSCYTRLDSVSQQDAKTSAFDVTYTGLTGVERDARVKKYFRYFTNMGLRCDFTIVDPKRKFNSVVGGIQYLKDYLPYVQIIQKTINSKATLEVVQNGLNYSTLRLMEAIVYGRKLLTENMEDGNVGYISSHRVFLLKESKLSQIPEFLSTDIKPFDDDSFSPLNLISFIKNALE